MIKTVDWDKKGWKRKNDMDLCPECQKFKCLTKTGHY